MHLGRVPGCAGDISKPALQAFTGTNCMVHLCPSREARAAGVPGGTPVQAVALVAPRAVVLKPEGQGVQAGSTSEAVVPAL